MSERPARPRRWWKYILITAAALLVAVLAALWYTTTKSFQAYVRRRMVQEVERITGGRAEIGSFHVVPFHLQVEVRDITVHGREGPDDVPLVHAASMLAQMKVVSFLRTEFGFTSLVLDHPVIHVAIGADGVTTNVPALKVQQAGLPSVVALMGSSLCEAQEKFLQQFRHVVLFLDGDQAGREATGFIAARLISKTFVKVMNLPEGKQPDELSSDEIKKILP